MSSSCIETLKVPTGIVQFRKDFARDQDPRWWNCYVEAGSESQDQLLEAAASRMALDVTYFPAALYLLHETSLIFPPISHVLSKGQVQVNGRARI